MMTIEGLQKRKVALHEMWERVAVINNELMACGEPNLGNAVQRVQSALTEADAKFDRLILDRAEVTR